MLNENNVIDDLLKQLPKEEKKELHDIYKIISLSPEHIKFIDRLEINSRDSALAHTGGLSGPQQIRNAALKP